MWLTEVERQQERLTRVHEYRLPTDFEWSMMAGIPETPDVSPAKREPFKAAIFPWGKDWPPPSGAGNFSDATVEAKFGFESIKDYNDGFATTSPVRPLTKTAPTGISPAAAAARARSSARIMYLFSFCISIK